MCVIILAYICMYVYVYMPKVAPLIGRVVLSHGPVGFHDGAIATSRADYISVPFGIER